MQTLEFNIEYLLPVITGTLLFGLLTVFIIYFILLYRKTRVKLNFERERLKQEVLRVENEVKEQTLTNVSRELHDNLGQIASLIKINLNMLSRRLKGEDLEQVQESLELIQRLINDVKALSASLKGERLRKHGWTNSIEEDIQRMNALGGINIELSIDGTSNLSHEKEFILYRIIQELSNNTLKHSKAQNARLSISCHENVSITFEDNGIGFNPNAIQRGSGLNNIEERCKMINADLTMASKPGKGSKIQITIANHGKRKH